MTTTRMVLPSEFFFVCFLEGLGSAGEALLNKSMLLIS
jgi:hypothetical protein